MKTLICVQPGQFEYQSADRPMLTKNHAIIKIKRIGICGTDLHAFQGDQPFLEYPRILGHELAGEIVEIDDGAEFKISEAVTFVPYFSCGKCVACKMGKPNCCSAIKVCGVHQDGGMVEYISVPISSIIHGSGLTFDELALVEPFSIGAHGIRRAAIKPGENVLVVGAGPIGLGAMEFARIAGATVIALDINEKRLSFCKEKLNIPFTINAKKDDVMERLSEITKGDMPTVVIDATGNLKAINNGFSYLAHGGRYVLIGLQKGNIAFNHPEFHKREATLMSSRNATIEDFNHVIKSIKNKDINPEKYITHRTSFEHVKDEFEQWLDPKNEVIKAMVELN